MKFRTVVILVVAVVLFLAVGLRFKIKSAGDSRPQGGGGPEEKTTVSSPPAAPVRDFPAQFAGLEVSALSLGRSGGEPAVRLEKDAGVWKIPSLHGAAADSAVVRHLLADLSQSVYAPAPGGISADPAAAGLGSGQGFEIRLNPGEGEIVVALGYGLDGFARTYVNTPGQDGIYLVDADLRGDIGVYSNRDEEAPDAAFWLETRPADIDAAKLASLSFEGPGYHANFVKDADGAWLLTGDAPESGVSLDVGEFSRWIRDLAALTVSGVADPGRYVELGLQRPTHVLRFGFEHGVIASLAGIQAADGKYYVESSTRPGFPFLVPEWRFNLYFRRFFELFPDLAVSFNPADALFADLRRDGVNVKLMRSGRGWQAVGLPLAVRGEGVERWLSALSSWRAVDSLNPAGTPRPERGAPVAEVSLAGDARQFRLGSAHPRLGLPYIILDNGNAFTVSAREAQAMFPQFSDLFAFGPLFPGLSERQVVELSVSPPDDGSDGMRLAVFRDPEKSGSWLAETPSGAAPLGEDGARGIIAAPLAWNAVGLSDWDPVEPGSRGAIVATIRLESGATRTFAMTKNENAGLVQVGSHAYQISLAEYEAWLDRLGAIAAPPVPEPAADQSEATALEDAPRAAETPPGSGTEADEPAARSFLLPGLYPSDIDGIELRYPGWVPGARGIRILRENDRNSWTVRAGDNAAPLEPAAALRLIGALIGWTVDPSAMWDDAAYDSNADRMRLLLDRGKDGGTGIDVYMPAFGQALARVDDGRAGAMDFASLFDWLGTIEPMMFAVEAGAADFFQPLPSSGSPEAVPEPENDAAAPAVEGQAADPSGER